MIDLYKQLEKFTPASAKVPLEQALAALKFNHEGLIPAIAQQHDTGEVLMLAWMNLQAIHETLQTHQVCYWSRSRQTYWRKGETSGHTQTLIEMRIDCDGDSLLLLIDQLGCACHTLRHNCFYNKVDNDKISVIA